MRIPPKLRLTAHAVYNARGWFGRVNVYSGDKLAFYRVVRICRVCKSDALEDAYQAIKDSRASGVMSV